jgi:hypothetical protein
VNRRASLPGADELFRSTGSGQQQRRRSEPTRNEAPQRGGAAEDAAPEASGRVRHDQKITVYLTSQELLDLEQARLRLRAEFDLGVDRGRIVREAIAELLQDLHDEGPDAALVRRLS